MRQAIPGMTQIVTHIEPTGDAIARRASTAADEAKVRRIVEISRRNRPAVPPARHDRAPRGRRTPGVFPLHDGIDTPITDAHDVTERVERVLRGQVPDLGRVVIHVEPTARAATKDERTKDANSPSVSSFVNYPIPKERKMSTLLLKHADVLVTMDAERRRIADGGLYVRDNADRAGRADRRAAPGRPTR